MKHAISKYPESFDVDALSWSNYLAQDWLKLGKHPHCCFPLLLGIQSQCDKSDVKRERRNASCSKARIVPCHRILNTLRHEANCWTIHLNADEEIRPVEIDALRSLPLISIVIVIVLVVLLNSIIVFIVGIGSGSRLGLLIARMKSVKLGDYFLDVVISLRSKNVVEAVLESDK